MLKRNNAADGIDLNITKKRNKSGLKLRKWNIKVNKEQSESDISTDKGSCEDVLEKTKKTKENKDIHSVNTTSVYPLANEMSERELEKNSVDSLSMKENIMPSSISRFKDMFDQKVADSLKNTHIKMNHAPIIRCSSLEKGVNTFEGNEIEEKRNRRKLRDMKSKSFCCVDLDVGLVDRRRNSWDILGSIEQINSARKGEYSDGKIIGYPFAPYDCNKDNIERICTKSVEQARSVFNKNTQDNVKVTLRPRPIHLSKERPKSICLGTNIFGQSESRDNGLLIEKCTSDLDLTRIASSTVINTNTKKKKLPFKKKKKSFNISNDKNADVANNTKMLHKITNSELNVRDENKPIHQNNIKSNDKNNIGLGVSNSLTKNSINLKNTDDSLQGNILDGKDAVKNSQPVSHKTESGVKDGKSVAMARTKESIRKFGISPMNNSEYLNNKDNRDGDNRELDRVTQILDKPPVAKQRSTFKQEPANDSAVKLRPRPIHLRNERPKSMDFRVSLSTFEQNQLHSHCLLQEKSNSDLDLTRIASISAIDRTMVKKKLPFKKKKKLLNGNNDIGNCLDSDAPINTNAEATSNKDSNITHDSNLNVIKATSPLMEGKPLSNFDTIDSPIIIVNDTTLIDLNSFDSTLPIDVSSKPTTKSTSNDINEGVSVLVTNHLVNSNINVKDKVTLRPRPKHLREERPKSMDFSLGLNTIEQNKLKSSYLSNYLSQEKSGSNVDLTRIASTEALDINNKKKRLPIKKKKKPVNVQNNLSLSPPNKRNSKTFNNNDLTSIKFADSSDTSRTDSKSVNETSTTVINHIDLNNMNDSISNDLRALDVVSNDNKSVALGPVDLIEVNDINSNNTRSNHSTDGHGKITSSVKLDASKYISTDNANANYTITSKSDVTIKHIVTQDDNTTLINKTITTERRNSGKSSVKEFQNFFDQRIGNGTHQARRPRRTNLLTSTRSESFDFDYRNLGRDGLATNSFDSSKVGVTRRSSEHKVGNKSQLERTTNRLSLINDVDAAAAGDTKTQVETSCQLSERISANRNIRQTSLVGRHKENALGKDKSIPSKDISLLKDSGESKINNRDGPSKTKMFNPVVIENKDSTNEDIRKNVTVKDTCNSNKKNIVSDEMKNLSSNSTDDKISERLEKNTSTISVQESDVSEEKTKTKTKNKLPFMKKRNDSRVLKAMQMFQQK